MNYEDEIRDILKGADIVDEDIESIIIKTKEIMMNENKEEEYNDYEQLEE